MEVHFCAAGVLFMKRGFIFGGHTILQSKSGERVVINRNVACGGHGVLWITSRFSGAP